jgi:hypothetical protein
MKLPRNERQEVLLTLKQSTARLTVEALRLGCSPTDVLCSVNRALDEAGEVSRVTIEFVGASRHAVGLVQ